MRRRRRLHATELEWDSQTVSWSSPDVFGRDSNLWMLAEDAGNEIWGQFYRRSRAGDEAAFIEECSTGLADLLCDAIPEGSGYDRDVTGALGNMGMMVAREFVLSGELNYELCFGYDPNDEETTPAAVSMRYIPHSSLVRIGRRRFQVVPQGALGEDEPSRVIPIEPGRVIEFVPPDPWRKRLNRIRDSLPMIGKSQRDWMHRSIESKADEAFKDVRRSYNIAIARTTREIGWNGRSLWQEQSADFHWIVRELRWKRFCVDMRDHIVDTLSRAFTKVGEAFGERPTLVVRSLPTLNDIDEAERKLKAGATRFDVLLGPFLYERK